MLYSKFLLILLHNILFQHAKKQDSKVRISKVLTIQRKLSKVNTLITLLSVPVLLNVKRPDLNLHLTFIDFSEIFTH